MAIKIAIENGSIEKLDELRCYAEKIGLELKIIEDDGARAITKPRENNKRSFIKSISYRFYQSFIISPLIIWVLTGNPVLGLKFGVLEVLVKIPAYYLFERIWARIGYGYKK